MERKTYVELSNNGGYFSKFEWKEDPYERYRDHQSTAREKHDKAQSSVHGMAPFLNMPKRQKPLRHESDF